ncbi:MAG TPA: hypothetical protein VMU41_08495 [Candidatus Binataceae bacterium]|nr:hypothetical protein [Candidatus Binataceae bacterium]
MRDLKWRARGHRDREWPVGFRIIGRSHAFAAIRVMVLLGTRVLLPGSAALAQEAPSLRVILRPELITEVADQALPLKLNPPADPTDVTSQQLTITELLYCGSDERGDGRMIGVIDEGDAPLRARSLEPSDCDQPLPTIAGRELRVPGSPEWVAAARLRLSWQLWRLALAVVDSSSAARPGFTTPNLPSAASRGVSYPTRGLQPLTGPGQNLKFDLAVGFRRNGVIIDAYPGGTASNPDGSFLSEDALTTAIQSSPSSTNVIAEARYGFVNQMLAIYSPTFNIPVSVQGLSTILFARDLSVKGADNQLTLTGKIIGQNLTYDSRVDCAGEDLAVQQVSMEAERVNCARPDMMSWLQCQAGHGLAAALTGYYQNQSLHVSTQSRPLHFSFGGTRYEAYFSALKTSSHSGVLSEAGQATLQRVASQPPLQHD